VVDEANLRLARVVLRVPEVIARYMAFDGLLRGHVASDFGKRLVSPRQQSTCAIGPVWYESFQ
jgi:hypothetical protein